MAMYSKCLQSKLHDSKILLSSLSKTSTQKLSPSLSFCLSSWAADLAFLVSAKKELDSFFKKRSIKNLNKGWHKACPQLPFSASSYSLQRKKIRHVSTDKPQKNTPRIFPVTLDFCYYSLSIWHWKGF